MDRWIFDITYLELKWDKLVGVCKDLEPDKSFSYVFVPNATPAISAGNTFPGFCSKYININIYQ